MKKTLFTLIFFFSLLSNVLGQTIITGQVINQDSGEPIPDVNVFLSQTTLGATTDENGVFTIEGIPNGIYNLVFSFIGFKTEVKRVQFFTPDSLSYKVTLHPVDIKMGGILVTAERDYEWLENLELFKQQFIGTSENAEKTVIKNPEILNFGWNEDDMFTASANQELHIVNNALGYEIFLVLKKFNYTPSTHQYSDFILYITYPRFKKMKPLNEGQKKMWIENRKETYEGSQRHFMQALYHNNTGDEYFNIENGSIDKIEKKEKEYLLRLKLLSQAYKNRLKGFQYSIYKDRIVIQYRQDETSFLYPVKQNIFFIDEYGNVLNPESIFVGGKWHNDRIADALPINYSPSE
ncbi:MAG TPA: carboxypeptidase-like regulatory domain-containing protein [Balneolaceae bacterium]